MCGRYKRRERLDADWERLWIDTASLPTGSTAGDFAPDPDIHLNETPIGLTRVRSGGRQLDTSGLHRRSRSFRWCICLEPIPDWCSSPSLFSSWVQSRCCPERSTSARCRSRRGLPASGIPAPMAGCLATESGIAHSRQYTRSLTGELADAASIGFDTSASAGLTTSAATIRVVLRLGPPLGRSSVSDFNSGGRPVRLDLFDHRRILVRRLSPEFTASSASQTRSRSFNVRRPVAGYSLRCFLCSAIHLFSCSDEGCCGRGLNAATR